MAFEPWDFIVAEQALWAGDVQFAEEHLKRGERFQDYRADPSSIEGPLGLMSHIAALRRPRLAQRRGARARFRAANSTGVGQHPAGEDEPRPTVLSGFQNVRGILCSVSAREFVCAPS